MNVLVLDDRPEALRQIETTIKKERRLSYKLCSQIDEVRSEWDSKKYQCIVTDLCLNPDDLGEYMPLTAGALLTGWVWLIKYVLLDDTNPMIEKTIIFSQYIPEAEKIIFDDEYSDIYKPDLFKRIKRVPKARAADIGGLAGLLDELRVMLAKYHSNKR